MQGFIFLAKDQVSLEIFGLAVLQPCGHAVLRSFRFSVPQSLSLLFTSSSLQGL